MNIQFKPQDENHPPDKRVNTNIGEFFPGEIRGVSPEQEDEANRLIENGDFVKSDGEPNTNELAEKMPKSVEKWNAAKAKRDAAAAETAEAEAKKTPASKK
jgi:hypothetical protein